jgi:hypothetical protein
LLGLLPKHAGRQKLRTTATAQPAAWSTDHSSTLRLYCLYCRPSRASFSLTKGHTMYARPPAASSALMQAYTCRGDSRDRSEAAEQQPTSLKCPAVCMYCQNMCWVSWVSNVVEASRAAGWDRHRSCLAERAGGAQQQQLTANPNTSSRPCKGKQLVMSPSAAASKESNTPAYACQTQGLAACRKYRMMMD